MIFLFSLLLTTIVLLIYVVVQQNKLLLSKTPEPEVADQIQDLMTDVSFIMNEIEDVLDENDENPVLQPFLRLQDRLHRINGAL